MEKNHFGTVIITSGGSIDVSNAYAPIWPFTQTEGIMNCCNVVKKKVVNPDGSVSDKEYLPVYFSLDHRYVDGVLCAKMVNEARKCFEDPSYIKVV